MNTIPVHRKGVVLQVPPDDIRLDWYSQDTMTMPRIMFQEVLLLPRLQLEDTRLGWLDAWTTTMKTQKTVTTLMDTILILEDPPFILQLHILLFTQTSSLQNII